MCEERLTAREIFEIAGGVEWQGEEVEEIEEVDVIDEEGMKNL